MIKYNGLLCKHYYGQLLHELQSHFSGKDECHGPFLHNSFLLHSNIPVNLILYKIPQPLSLTYTFGGEVNQ